MGRPEDPATPSRHLGHRSITTTLDRYAYLFEDEHDRLADRIADAYRSFAAPQDSAGASGRPSPGAH